MAGRHLRSNIPKGLTAAAAAWFAFNPGFAAAQRIDSPNPGSFGNFGGSLSPTGDLDGDGVADLLIGASGETASLPGGVISAGRFYVVSGKSTAILRTVASPNPASSRAFGNFVTDVGDLDGDAVPDVMAGDVSEWWGAPRYAGRAYVFSGAGGGVIHVLQSPAPAFDGRFGLAGTGIGDVNGDRVPDLVVSAPFEDGNGAVDAGIVYVFSGATGEVLRTLTSPGAEQESLFGNAVASTGDLNGDGVRDLIIGAQGEDAGGGNYAGRAYLYSGATGALIRPLESPNRQMDGYFGFSVASAGRVDADFVDDVMISAPGERHAGTFADGRVYVFSGLTGALIHTLASPAAADHADLYAYFGMSISSVGDQNGDGRADLLIGAKSEKRSTGTLLAHQAGRVYIFSGLNGSVLRTLYSPFPEQEGHFGSAVTGVPDLTGDGRADFLVSAEYENGTAIRDVGRVYLFGRPLVLYGPSPDTTLFPGTTYAIRWQAGPEVQNVTLRLKNGVPTAASNGTAIALTVPASHGRYDWLVPNTLMPQARIILSSAETDAKVVGEAFRIKDYQLTRIRPDTTYDAYRPSRNSWSFPNTEAQMFPSTYWNLPRFDYGIGTDPFSMLQYDRQFVVAPISATPKVFPDWPAFVTAFGTDNTYEVLDPGVEAFYTYSALLHWRAFHNGKGWAGSCAGMAVSSLLGFLHKPEFIEAFPSVGPIDTLFNHKPNLNFETDTRAGINAFFIYQAGMVQQEFMAGANSLRRTPRQTLEDLKELFLSDDPARNSTLGLMNQKSCNPYELKSGAHEVTPYRLERLPGAGGIWFIYIYDPNSPGNDAAAIRVDSTANTWSYNVSVNAGVPPEIWSGECGLYVLDPIENYFDVAVLPPDEPDLPGKRRPALEGLLGVYASPAASIEMVDADGRRTGYVDSTAFTEVEDAHIVMPRVGGYTAPSGFLVPSGRHTVSLSDNPDTSLSAIFFDGGSIYAFGREDAALGQTDRLVYAAGEGLSFASLDASSTKKSTLLAVVSGVGSERTLIAGDVTLTGSDSLRIYVEEGARLRITNWGGAKHYDLSLEEGAGSEARRFTHGRVSLEAGATHLVRPDWEALEQEPVPVEVDRDGDGTPEETILVENTAVAGEKEPVGARPMQLALAENRPNPFSAVTTLRFGLPAAGPATLAVYDVLGRRIALLAEGHHAAGWHEVRFGAQGLPSGTYLVRLTAGRETATRLITLAR